MSREASPVFDGPDGAETPTVPPTPGTNAERGPGTAEVTVVRVDERLVTRIGARVIVALAVGGLVSIVIQYATVLPEVPGKDAIDNFLDLNSESGFGTWVSVAGLVLCAAAAAYGAFHARAQGATTARWRGWAALATVYALMSMDEVTKLHERTGGLLGEVFDVPKTVWVLPALIIVGAVVWLLRDFAAELSPIVRRRLGVALVVYVGGAVGLEIVGDLVSVEDTLGSESVSQVEEFAELVGILLLLRASLTALRVRGVDVRVRFAASEVPPL